jgi:phosphoglucosamine mutase
VKVVIGKDTRVSSDMIEAALIAGLNSGGADVVTLGVAPTPAVAYITTELKADAGIVISASHNSYEDNGVKLFNSQGFKLSDALEAQIEELVTNCNDIQPVNSEHIGRVIPGGKDHLIEYIHHLRKCGNITKRLKIAVDCANGASEVTAERLFGPYAAELHILHDQPNGLNINDKCGSTAPERLQAVVTAFGCDVGFAFDGDADRCIAVDERGSLVGGDLLMGVIGRWMKRCDQLPGDTVVATVMSNLGLTEFFNRENLRLLKAPVGDRNVLALMQREGAVLGGEQSGHVIFLNDATTGDGQLCAVKLLTVLTERGVPLSELTADIKIYPQVLIGVKVSDKEAAMNSPNLKAAIAAAEAELGDSGSILVRPSGTEPLIRVNVEAPDEELATHIASAVAATIDG